MRTKIEIENRITITASEDGRHLTFIFVDSGDGIKMVDFDSNLPYEKSLEDWEFYGRAIVRIIKKLNFELFRR